MTAMLDVAVGLIFVYLVLSLLASSVAEALEHFFRYRAEYLRQGVEKLLLAGDAALRQTLYTHPLIKSLYTTSWWEGKGRAAGPSYIPSRQFVLALLDVVTRAGSSSAPPNPAAATAFTPAQLLASIDAGEGAGVIPSGLAGSLRTLIADAGNDVEKVKANIQQWFDGSMDRVAGWYKRRAQFVLLIIGVFVAVGINVDTLEIVHTLSNDSAVRGAVVAAAEAYARDNSRPATPAAQGTTGQAAAGAAAGEPPSLDQVTSAVQTNVEQVVGRLETLGLPIGWRYYDPALDGNVPAGARERHLVEERVWPPLSGTWLDDWWAQFASHLLGWTLTAFALSFGAPFWFDMLNKIMVIRSTVKPHEKSQEEASEDRQMPETSRTVRIEVAPAKS
jgi:hypothetical protein